MLCKGCFLSVFRAALLTSVLNSLMIYIYFTGTPTENLLSSINTYFGKDYYSNYYPFVYSHVPPFNITVSQKQLSIIYYKTHKTASTTLGNIIFRLGAQHGARFLDSEDHYYTFPENASRTADISLNHHRTWPLRYEKMLAHYRKLIPTGKLLSVLRNPVRRYLSHFHYFVEPDTNKTFTEYLDLKGYNNFLAIDFGVYEEKEFKDFMETVYPQFFFVITEKFDESLLLLKNAWGWTLEDILYININEACKAGHNYAYKPMSCRPQIGDLTEEEMQRVKQNNAWDIILYDRALNETNALLDAQPPSFWAELKLFKQMKEKLLEVCPNITSPNKACHPFHYNDQRYEHIVWETSDGVVSEYPVPSFKFV